ncbi:unnamed protein product [Blepharisma stoltei]|uniref:Dickkopf N-terminal cysteine-rich domain-containing protein n=1 Tax=Blepharisma stoltei TaxID=1481888 RepID=A0AAU9K9M4_9CILI|nr:unnamed protein product [Blepharisma stoltei]
MLLKVWLCIFFAYARLGEENSLKVEKIQFPRDISPMTLNNYIQSRGNEALICPKYFCKPNDMVFTTGTCVYENESTESFYVQKCNSDYVCDMQYPVNYTCIIPPYFSGSNPGEKCNTLADCSQYCTNCTNNICLGVSLNSNCQYHLQCNPGLACSSNNVCIAQIPIGGYGCRSDYDCVNTAGCNSTYGQLGSCLSYFSIPPHQYVGLCNGGQSSLCSSISCASNGQQYLCTIPLLSASATPVSCLSNSDCLSTSDPFFNPPFSLQGYCSCGLNSNGISYCPLSPGDALYLKYLNQYQKWIMSPEINKCNTVDRFDTACISNWWDNKNFTTFMNYFLNVGYYSQVQNTPLCVLQTLMPEYLQYSNTGPFCPSFQCKTASQVFASNQCVFYDGNQNFYVKACSDSNTVCNFVSLQNATCVPIIKYPGQNCTFSNECFTYACANGVCQGGGKGSKCKKSAECDPGLYCSSDECKPLKGMGERCTSDSTVSMARYAWEIFKGVFLLAP